MSMLRPPKLHFLTARACRKEFQAPGRLADLNLPSYIWGEEPFEESAATRVGPKARLGRRNEAVRPQGSLPTDYCWEHEREMPLVVVIF